MLAGRRVATAIELLQQQPHRLQMQVYTPARGLYIHARFYEAPGPPEAPPSPPVPPKTKVKEEDFYEVFAEWLVEKLEECTTAGAVGGRLFKDEWGTPDVRESARAVNATGGWS